MLSSGCLKSWMREIESSERLTFPWVASLQATLGSGYFLFIIKYQCGMFKLETDKYWQINSINR